MNYELETIMEKLTSPTVIRALMARHDLHFNKRYGQNFLIDSNIVYKIVQAGNVTEDDTILEIGPGIGTMTACLCENASQVIAVEIDKKLIPVLEETLNPYDNVTVINDDILNLIKLPDFDDILNPGNNSESKQSLKVVANLPYYITTPIIMSLLESDLEFEQLTFLVQKEVGERICAVPGCKAYGSLTIACAYYAQTEIAFDVPADVFMPKPKVDSVVITLKKRQSPAYMPKDKAAFFRIIKAAFLNRRKTLLNGLNNNTSYSKDEILTALSVADIDPGIRAEQLSGDDFVRLTNAFTMCN